MAKDAGRSRTCRESGPGCCKIKRIRDGRRGGHGVPLRKGRGDGGVADPRPSTTTTASCREVGHTSGFSAREKRELLDHLEPYRTHERGSGEPSRWKSSEELVWEGLRPELVCEIAFDHITGNRIRHGAKFRRWRPDKEPRECRMEQLHA